MVSNKKILAVVTAVLLVGILVGAATAQQSLNRLERTGVQILHVPGLENSISFSNNGHFTSAIAFDVEGQLVSIDSIRAIVSGYEASSEQYALRVTIGDTTVMTPVSPGTRTFDFTGAFTEEGAYPVDSWIWNGRLDSIDVMVEYTYIPEEYLN